MKIILAAVGRLKNGPERELCARYLERAQASARGVALTGVEMKEIDEGRARRVEDRKAEEARVLAGLITDGARLIVLDERGRPQSSAEFAADIGRARDDGMPAYVFVIGGPDGIDPDLRARAHKVIAFGAMTWPHQLVRIMAAEQIYRAITILAGHPYHRV
ncbi:MULTISPECIES: 23S rRNA (pseudouridine(1915)-N(3))-methyltransferase RlmH [unclassified Beijerinckia]|uniref:23S rRNA (pseudouridine(1915)-N(3))-methyltransferase RlmH n=1 Tax=unclassified Beijerinckia TaxID=2638183 RepID=UPI00089635E9|nr:MULTISPECIES: 23S rRNA (pseudouridine(1915)-N(3))-methyltransferase RlmH [unclassified Beijerinckia]MDH7798316.1 23S rRNA (pseudouridine1915-N3)-methyltransferase [Beijerinckia sp. GAS462]SED16781.1 23S rRNA (pseudouridine1915-N3)-methyltransferase [Beijerinckia sp. 28-YEA-48]